MRFSEWNQIREAVASPPVSGDGVRALQAAVKSHSGDFVGLDREIYANMLAAGHLDSESVQSTEVLGMLRLVSKHGEYGHIKSMVNNDIASSLSKDIAKALTPRMPRVSSPSPSRGRVKVYDLGRKEYGKFKVNIPGGIARLSIEKELNEIIDSVLKAEGQLSKRPPRFKKLQDDRTSREDYWIHPSVMGPVMDLLKSKGFQVEYESGSSGSAMPVPTSNPDIQVLGRLRTSFGNKVAVKFNYDRSKGLFDKMADAGLRPNGISYDREEKRFLINIDDLDLFDRVLAQIKAHGLDAKPLEDFAASIGHKPSDPGTDAMLFDKDDVFIFRDAPGNLMIVKTIVEKLPFHIRSFIRESIQYNFPEYRYDTVNWQYTVTGNFKQYATFGRLLSRFGYKVDDLREIVRKKLADGRLKKTEYEGRYDKDKEFQDSIEEKIPESMVDLYDEQKFGVAFLYGRDSAILGDETGFGKSIQLITAAALRMQATNKPTLIITLKATQKQFASEILRVVGEKERDQISMDPMNPKRWTVIRYSDFSGGKEERNKKVLANIESLKRAGFGVAILDELHKVKHGKSQRSQNISAALEGIQTRWGASATVSSNKPMDVKNQLLVMGHQLGRVSEAKFKRDFAGMEPVGYKGSLKKTDNEEKEIQAAERLNKWLNLSGVYVRREKGDIRDMPELSVSSEETGIDAGRFQSMYASKLQTYKNPDLAVSRLIAAREVVAQLKTDETVSRVNQIVRDGEGKPPAASKVVVFTNFIGAGRLLVDKISSVLRGINPDYKVITYLSDTKRKEREEVKERFTNDPDIKVLVMSMKMGGTGIDFPNAAQHMIINDFDWTPESAEQSEGRIYRINTDHAVKIQYVVGRGIDQELFERVQRKREISAIIQKYRREYHDSEASPEALRKIVAAQKEIKKIDDEMVRIVASNLPGAEGAMSESFSSYLNCIEGIREAMTPTE